MGASARSGTGGSTGWREKLHPFFLETAQVCCVAVKKGNRIGNNRSDPRWAEIDSSLRRDLQAIRDKYGDAIEGALDPLDTVAPFAETYSLGMDEGQIHEAIIKVRHYRRTGEPFDITEERYRAGSFDAVNDICETILASEAHRLNSRPLRFKVNEEHELLFEQGIGAGLENLTPAELEACFKTLCPCGKPHKAERLRKQRERFIKRLAKIQRYRENHPHSAESDPRGPRLPARKRP